MVATFLHFMHPHQAANVVLQLYLATTNGERIIASLIHILQSPQVWMVIESTTQNGTAQVTRRKNYTRGGRPCGRHE
jgi:hypothetical protein